MGAKQSKRSVDISGKEAEGAGEVAAAGAGGEGRVEALADADALKPQLNGDAHIHEQDKEKQLDSGTPENEKDATTEKENKEPENESDKEKEAAPVSNGDTEPKGENGDTPASEDAKKPKKEKVKKKWSLRSISFSRKDKPKQEKKQKEEEAKTNGEPEKVPEEAAEVTAENAVPEVAEEVKPEPPKEEKTPETPVTEPLTNGSSTPESAKAESPAVEETSAPAAAASPDKEEPKPEVQPEQLPVNGLSLEEPKTEAVDVQIKENKIEESTDTTETAPAPEIPVKKEVCVEQMPLESTPPPLPANPPPSSVVSFAATTMAPELTDASLANTAELVISAPSTVPDVDANKVDVVAPEAPVSPTNINIEVNVNTEIDVTELPPPFKESSPTLAQTTDEDKQQEKNIESDEISGPAVVESMKADEADPKEILEEKNVDLTNTGTEETNEAEMVIEAPAETDTAKDINDITQSEGSSVMNETNCTEVETETVVQEVEMKPAYEDDDLPPPPPADEYIESPNETETSKDIIDSENIDTELETGPKIISNHVTGNIDFDSGDTPQLNGNSETEHENIKNKSKDLLGNIIVGVECNGNVEDAAGSAADLLPPPPADLCAATPQDPMPVSDKLADLIPEVPVVPELNTETLQETTTDVAVAN